MQIDQIDNKIENKIIENSTRRTSEELKWFESVSQREIKNAIITEDLEANSN